MRLSCIVSYNTAMHQEDAEFFIKQNISKELRHQKQGVAVTPKFKIYVMFQRLSVLK